MAAISCVRRSPVGILDPKTAPPPSTGSGFSATPTFTITETPIDTFTVTATFSATMTFTIAAFSNTATPTLTATPSFTATRTFTATFTSTTPAGLDPYLIRGEAAFSMVLNAAWTTSAYPNSEMVRGAPPYTSWTAPTASDAVMYGGFNSVAGTGPTWCTPLTTFTTFQVNQDLTDKVVGAGSLRFSGQQGGYSWGGWTYWGLTINQSWSTVSLAPFLTGIEYWAKDLQPNGHQSTVRIGLRETDVMGANGPNWALDQALSPSWTLYQHDYLSMNNGWPGNPPITSYTATGPTTYGGLAGSGAGAACNWAYLLDEVKLY